ncbi:MAG TPA: mannosyltransferase family protein [Bryocella sp.]|nr:mannosyltransferase family protein [Bryocella sp.]
MSPQLPTVGTPTAQASVWDRFRTWNRNHPALWISAVTFLASCLFAYGFGQVAHWTTGARSTRLTDFCIWDCSWYSSIVSPGYDIAPRPGTSDSANWAFFPLFPLTARACKYALHVEAHTATVLTSKLEFFTAILAFLLWLGPYLETMHDRFLAAMLVAFNPYLIYGHAGYSEPLYFTLLCLGFWALERRNWILAGLLGGAVSANRIVGVVFAVVYAIAAVREVGLRGILRDRSLKVLIGLALCPLGLVLYSLYLYHLTGDALASLHVHKAGWHHTITNPFITMANSYHQHGWFRVWTVMALGGLAVSGWLMRRRHLEYGIFLALIILIAMSGGLVWAFPRYLWWEPPLLYAIFFWLRRSLPACMVYFAFAGGMASFMVIAWFLGTNIVT